MPFLQAVSSADVLGLSLAFLKGKKSFRYPFPCEKDGRISLLHLNGVRVGYSSIQTHIPIK